MNSCPWSRNVGNVSRSSGLAKTMLLGTMNGMRRSRQKTECEDNIKEWTGLHFTSSTSQLKIAQAGKVLLRSHLWCSNHLERLWDRLD